MDTNQKSPDQKKSGGKKPYYGKKRYPNKHHGRHHADRRDRQELSEEALAEAVTVTDGTSEGAAASNTPAPEKKQAVNASDKKDGTDISEEGTASGDNGGKSFRRNDASRHQQRGNKSASPKRYGDQSSGAVNDVTEEVADYEDGASEAERIEKILNHDIFAKVERVIPDEIPEGKFVVVGIRFRPGGKTYYFDPGQLICRVGDCAIVETAQGLEFGEVHLANCLVDESRVVPPLRPIVRIATPQDIEQNSINHSKEKDAFVIGKELIAKAKLDMHLVSAQYTFDNSKLLFYFTSDDRVDFRELVKQMARTFATRIELRQIGIRDKARMLGGFGACGRPLCCSTFLSDFGQVSMKMAKEQNLSLSNQKISGVCGRLMCCLRFEHADYVAALKELPSPGTFVLVTKDQKEGKPEPGVVTDVLPIEDAVKISLKSKPDVPPQKYLKGEYVVADRSHHRQNNSTQPQEPARIEEPDSDD